MEHEERRKSDDRISYIVDTIGKLYENQEGIIKQLARMERLEKTVYGNGEEGICGIARRHDESIKDLADSKKWIVRYILAIVIAGIMALLFKK